jgi:hypothetical protein
MKQVSAYLLFLCKRISGRLRIASNLRTSPADGPLPALNRGLCRALNALHPQVGGTR